MDFKLYETVLDKHYSLDHPYISTDDITNTNSNTCKHTDCIIENGLNICLECGQEIDRIITHDKEWRYYGNKMSDPNRAHARKIDDKSIIKDVKGMNFSEQVINKANELYVECTNGKIYRGGSRKSIVFACIYNAYKIVDQHKTPESLVHLFGITRKEGLKGLKIFNINISSNSVVHDLHITFEHIIRDLMIHFTNDKLHVKEVIELHDRIHNRSSKLNRARPQSVAAAIIFYWIRENNINIKIEEFALLSKLSELTIVKNIKEVERILSR